MKVAHWTMFNKSGMFRVAESMVVTEKKLGIDSVLMEVKDTSKYDLAMDADVHVLHTHFPDEMRKKLGSSLKLVWVGHGVPDHIFKASVELDANRNIGAGDGWMLMQHWMQVADAIVTFWPRHQWIYKSMCDKNTIVDCIPLGVDKEFWKPIKSKGKYTGSPSLFTAENGYQIKWPWDLFLIWPHVAEKIQQNALLHVAYLPNDQHRFWFPLINRNGASYASEVNSLVHDHESLRNVFCSTDYYIGLVRYGDHNRICLEANACGSKTISYRGNPYSDYWMTEGDQRVMADELLNILEGKTKPREKTPVPDIIETSNAMIKIYERILKKTSIIIDGLKNV